MYVQFFKTPDRIFHKSVTYDGELQLPLQYNILLIVRRQKKNRNHS